MTDITNLRYELYIDILMNNCTALHCRSCRNKCRCDMLWIALNMICKGEY